MRQITVDCRWACIIAVALMQPAILGAQHPSAAPDVAVTSSTKPGLTATPNPVPIGGRTAITWTTGDGSPGEVYVSINGDREILFAGASPYGRQEADWIGPGDRSDFRL